MITSPSQKGPTDTLDTERNLIPKAETNLKELMKKRKNLTSAVE
jgi:hypothetical protein